METARVSIYAGNVTDLRIVVMLATNVHVVCTVGEHCCDLCCN